ncbi:MAG: hypothetical protein II951_12570 [Bacteroidales bacterium]|nr:hypothetical protein [Bacteroidales bacterium]
MTGVECAGSSTNNVSSSDEAEKVEASLNWSHEAEGRVGSALAAVENMRAAGRYISSIAELIKNRQMPMPVGIKSKTYTICGCRAYHAFCCY